MNELMISYVCVMCAVLLRTSLESLLYSDPYDPTVALAEPLPAEQLEAHFPKSSPYFVLESFVNPLCMSAS